MSTPAPQSAPQGFSLVYSTTGTSAIRMVQFVTVAFGTAGVFFAGLLLQAPVEQNISHTSKVSWAVVLGLVALGLPLVGYLYVRKLVLKMWLSDDKKVLRLEQPAFFGTTVRELPRASLRVAHFTDGDSAGEKALAPKRFDIHVEGGGDFTIVLDGHAAQQRAAVIDALQG